MAQHSDIAASFSTHLTANDDPTVKDLYGALSRVIASTDHGYKVVTKLFQADRIENEDVEHQIEVVRKAYTDWQKSACASYEVDPKHWSNSDSTVRSAILLTKFVRDLDDLVASLGYPLSLPKLGTQDKPSCSAISRLGALLPVRSSWRFGVNKHPSKPDEELPLLNHRK